jgi:hypothetical protein
MAAWVVTSPGDNLVSPQPGTPPYAIQQINAGNDLANSISFNLGGSAVVQPVAQLPAIAKPVAIDGANTLGGRVEVELSGAQVGLSSGLLLGPGSSGSVVHN